MQDATDDKVGAIVLAGGVELNSSTTVNMAGLLVVIVAGIVLKGSRAELVTKASVEVLRVLTMLLAASVVIELSVFMITS